MALLLPSCGSRSFVIRLHLLLILAVACWNTCFQGVVSAAGPPPSHGKWFFTSRPFHVLVRPGRDGDSRTQPTTASSEGEQPSRRLNPGKPPWRFPGLNRIAGSLGQWRNNRKKRINSTDGWSFPGKDFVRGVIIDRARSLLNAKEAMSTTATRSAESAEKSKKKKVIQLAEKLPPAKWSFPGRRVVDFGFRRRRHVDAADAPNITLDEESPVETIIAKDDLPPTIPVESSAAEMGRSEDALNQTTLSVDTNQRSTTADENIRPVATGPYYAAISVLVIADDHKDESSTRSSIRPGCMLVSEVPETVTLLEGQWGDNSVAVWHSLALLSDVVVLVIQTADAHAPTILPVDLRWALVAGLRQRVYSGLARGRLLAIVMPSCDIDQWRERLVLDELKTLTPDIVEHFDVVTSSQYQDYLSDVTVLHRRGTHIIIDRASFVPLLQQTYHILGGRQEQPLLVETNVVDDTEDWEKRERSTDGDVGRVDDSSRASAILSENDNDKQENLLSEDHCVLKDPAQLPPKRGRVPWIVRSISNLRQASSLQFGGRAKATGSAKSGTAKPTASTRSRNPSLADQAILQSVLSQLNELQARQEDSLLDTGSLPMDFASYADPILSSLALIEQPQKPVLDFVQARMRFLYQQHLESLRDHFGKMYETMLDHSDQATWDAMKARVTSNFRQAAQQAVPVLAREGDIFRDLGLDYVGTLSGLTSDLNEATELRRGLTGDDELEDGIDVNSAARARRKRFVKWCKKLAARGLMLGVNYLQGWLAWQGIKRTALERERSMPKFPLF